MGTYLNMLPVTAASVIVTAGLYLAEKKTPFGTWKPRVRQWICGVIFGILAICGTEFGADAEGITLNVSTAPPLCAGLIFGAPAGIISGVIGGVERYFATFWGAGYYGRFAGTFSILFAGLAAAGMRRFMFDDKKPAWYYGLFGGIIAEVVDMLILLLSRIDDIRSAFHMVEFGTLPLVLMNGATVMFALLAVSAIGKPARKKKKNREQLAHAFQKWLLVCVTLAFLATGVFTFWIEDGISRSQNESVLRLNLFDVQKDIEEASDKNLLEIARRVKDWMEQKETDKDMDFRDMADVASSFGVAEVDIIDERGIITASNRDGVIGYDMAASEQSAAFLVLLNGEQEYVQRYQPSGQDSSIYRKYAGIALEEGGFLQVGYDAERFQADIDEQVSYAANNRHVGEKGYVIICDEDWTVVSDTHDHKGRDLSDTGYRLDEDNTPQLSAFEAEVCGQDSLCMYLKSEGYYIIAVLPEKEAVFARDVSIYLSIFMEIIIFTVLFILIYILTRNLIVDNIHKINRSLTLITKGNLDVEVDVRSNEEFASLADGINSTVHTLKCYIKEAEARIDKELALARDIQRSALPSVFPPYPGRSEFDIWAGMRPAKEVGGDFYDFYMLGENRLVFLVADVSGKGIPAAMFMMTAKTQIKSLTETGISVEEVLTEANEQLCANNDAGMFVTAWMGILDLETGKVEYGNAGHNPPLLRRADGSYEYLKSRSGLVLAGMEGIRYRKNELTLRAGDVIYLYTDGVTEATNAGKELYGEERLINRLDQIPAENPEAICRGVMRDVDDFVGDAPQFDDITMLCLKYRGCGAEITVDAAMDQIDRVLRFVDGQLKAAECPPKTAAQIDMAVDEILSNIIRYAYGDGSGKATVRVEITQQPSAVLTFIDRGSPFNPLEKEDPDVTIPAKERQIGGLGIFLVKNTMDEVDYEYREGANRLRIVKKWQ